MSQSWVLLERAFGMLELRRPEGLLAIPIALAIWFYFRRTPSVAPSSTRSSLLCCLYT